MYRNTYPVVYSSIRDATRPMCCFGGEHSLYVFSFVGRFIYRYTHLLRLRRSRCVAPCGLGVLRWSQRVELSLRAEQDAVFGSAMDACCGGGVHEFFGGSSIEELYTIFRIIVHHPKTGSRKNAYALNPMSYQSHCLGLYRKQPLIKNKWCYG